ncbi:HTH-type transcriptional repressor PurR [Clostridia bacterium]|nr:HTH-type transcriptional repressor PurR [Clostridia bacterium]
MFLYDIRVMKQNLSIKDIAKLAGVSGATVSYVINGKGGVSDEQRARIEAIIQEYDYRPNLNSRRLALRKNFLLHAVIRKEASPACKEFYFGVFAKMTEAVQSRGYSIASVFQSDDANDENITEIIREKSTDGFLIFQGTSPEHYREMDEQGIPYVIINPGLDAKDTPSVILDFEEMIYRATRYLAEQGHRLVGFIGMDCLPVFYENTVSGFQRAAAEFGLRADPAWVTGAACDADSAAACMTRILAGPELPTAIVCAQDNFAIPAMSAAKAAGYRIPEDISFVGLDDISVAKYLDPPLTTLRIDPAELSEAALGIIFRLIGGDGATSITLSPAGVTARGSVQSVL